MEHHNDWYDGTSTAVQGCKAEKNKNLRHLINCLKVKSLRHSLIELNEVNEYVLLFNILDCIEYKPLKNTLLFSNSTKYSHRRHRSLSLYFFRDSFGLLLATQSFIHVGLMLYFLSFSCFPCFSEVTLPDAPKTGVLLKVLHEEDLYCLLSGHSQDKIVERIEITIIECCVEYGQICIDEFEDKQLKYIGCFIAILVLMVL